MDETMVGAPGGEAEAAQVIFSDKDVQITPDRVVIRGTAYAMGDIQRVVVDKRQSWRVAAYLLFFLTGIYFREKHLPVAWTMFWLASAVCFYLENERPSQLIFSSPTNRLAVLDSTDRSYLKAIKAHIDRVLKPGPSPAVPSVKG